MFEERDPVFEEENQIKLIEQIENSPDCKVYGVNRFKQKNIRIMRGITIAGAILLSILVLYLNQSDIGALYVLLIGFAALVVYFILYYLNFPHRHYKTYVSSLGIAQKSERTDIAFPWDKIELIEVKDKGDDIEYILFRSGKMMLGYRNHYFVTRLTLEIVKEYVGDLKNWHIIEDFGEFEETTKIDRVYVNPAIEKAEAKKKVEDTLLREWIGDQDFDASKTEKQTSAKSDEELYHLILNDPQIIVIKDTGRFTRLFGNCRISILCMIIAVALTFAGMAGGPYSWLIWIVATILYVLVFYELFRSDERLYVSPIGIVRYYFGSPDALEWQHVEFIDFYSDGDTPFPYEFFGNNKRVFCPRCYYSELLSMEHIRQYLPELEQWKKVNQDIWEEGSFRLVRFEA